MAGHKCVDALIKNDYTLRVARPTWSIAIPVKSDLHAQLPVKLILYVGCDFLVYSSRLLCCVQSIYIWVEERVSYPSHPHTYPRQREGTFDQAR